MVVSATAPSIAVLFLFVVSFICFMSGAVLRRWPGEVQAYMERVDGSLWFVSAATHRALILATGIALTALSLLALIAAPLIAP
jgi:predicted Co/Zn/Cd cation transporter (cation efflux family)